MRTMRPAFLAMLGTLVISLAEVCAAESTLAGCDWYQVAQQAVGDRDVAAGGTALAISGDTFVLGAWFDGEFAGTDGAAYVFDRHAGSTDAWGQVARLTASVTHGFSRFGDAVSIDGDTIVVAASRDGGNNGTGSAFVFERNAGGANAWGQVARLTGAEAAENAFFGYSVSIRGDTIVAGAYGDIQSGSRRGAAYVFERNAGGANAWGQVARLVAPDGGTDDRFGWSVSIDEDTVVVGALNDDHLAVTDAGSAYVFLRNSGGAGAWGYAATLTASDAAANRRFGASVSISEDSLVVGGGDPSLGGSSPEAAYVFERNAGGMEQWGQVAKLTASDAAAGTWFGSSVSIDRDTISVGAPYRTTLPGPFDGAAYVFGRNAGGAGAWGEVTKLIASRVRDQEKNFGSTLSISGDHLVVASGYATIDGFSGYVNLTRYASVFHANCQVCGDGLLEIPEECDEGDENSDVQPDACRTDCTLPACGDLIVDSGEMCEDGNFVDGDGCDSNCTITGCGNGIVTGVEECDDGNLGPLDGCPNDCAAHECAYPVLETADLANAEFGISASIRGDLAVVGARLGDAAYLFQRNAGGAEAWGQVKKLSADPGEFGVSVSIDMDTVVVGAPRRQNLSGSAYVFQRHAGGADAWGQVEELTAADHAASDQFGTAVALDGDTIVVGAPYDDDAGSASGSAYVFERDAHDADAWGQVVKLTAFDAATDDQFGTAVSIHGDTIVVGARYDDDAGSISGSAYVFERNAGGASAWGHVAKLTAADAATLDVFGWSVAVRGDTVVVGALGESDRGSAYVFERNSEGPGAWGQTAKLTPPDSSAYRFGTSVSTSGDGIVVGADYSGDRGYATGAAYAYRRGTSGWSLWSKLDVAGVDANDRFGSSVSLSSDGLTAAIGAVWRKTAYIVDFLDCPVCGNGVVHDGEVCDDGNAVDGDACANDCSANVCGDGIVNGGELCDPADPIDGERCEQGCAPRIELSMRREADGAVTLEWSSLILPRGTVWSVLRAASPTALTLVAEQETPFYTETPPEAPLLFYRVVNRCGDGALSEGEECDDGNQISGDGCHHDCTLE